LGHDGDIETRVGLGNRNGSAQSCAAAAYQHHVVRRHASLLVEELVDQNLPVMPDDLPADAAVVVLVFDAAAAAGEIGRLRHDHLDIVVAVARAVHNFSAGC